MKKIVFIGAGSMAQAIIHGWEKEKTVSFENVYVMNKSDLVKQEYLKKTYGLQIICENKEQIRTADLIILATKPKDVQEAMKSISSYLSPSTVVLSVVAGVPMSTIEKGLGHRPIARCMPNTSATIGMSASAVSWNSLVEETTKIEIINLLNAIGTVIQVEEDKLHVITALSGSGPAYVYYFVEAFEEAAVSLGLSSKVARDLLIETLAGSAEMMKQSSKSPEVLRKQVTSPGGTTEAGLAALQKNNFIQILGTCLKDAELRSRELGKQYD
ncbi:pyrroline-5-carboxylate reductase [Paenisporosarcina quisquiliarum]|uniref:pyrroline-5-carboxylate reductase n=1 Tax=Paenisporosarcina quisquiliarum TaxID=365346 RepID=UPI003736B43C